jgi:WD40 repeat protein
MRAQAKILIDGSLDERRDIRCHHSLGSWLASACLDPLDRRFVRQKQFRQIEFLAPEISSAKSSVHRSKHRITARMSGLRSLSANRNLTLITVALLLSFLAAPFAVAQNATNGQSKKNQTDAIALPLIRTLPSRSEISTLGMFRSGSSDLIWSSDEQRLAAYVDNGLAIMLWSPDGAYQREISRYGFFFSPLLAFLFDHKQLITGPAARTKAHEDLDAVEDVAFSIVDAEDGHILRNVIGPNPGKTYLENVVFKLALSPNQRFVAVVYGKTADKRIAIYSVGDWQRIASIELDDSHEPAGLMFSPDSRLLSVINGPRGRVKIFEVGSWRLLRYIDAFQDKPPPMHVLSVTMAIFSPDSTMLAVGSFGGGAWRQYRNGSIAPNGAGTLTEEFPADPLRIIRVADGKQIAALKAFPGGFIDEKRLAWSPMNDAILFIDAIGDIRLWKPFREQSSVVLASVKHANTLLISRDGNRLAICAPDGVQLFNLAVVPR